MWEYKRESVHPRLIFDEKYNADLMKMLNEADSQGWELVTIVTIDSYGFATAIFRRPSQQK
jgi:phospholipase/lecithinase/hemolysin